MMIKIHKAIPGFVWRAVIDNATPESCAIADGSEYHPDMHPLDRDCRCWQEHTGQDTKIEIRKAGNP